MNSSSGIVKKMSVESYYYKIISNELKAFCKINIVYN